MKTFLSLLILVAASTLAFGQEKLDRLFAETTPEERARHQTDRMKEKLSLRQEQEEPVYTVNLAYAKKLELAHAQGGGKLQRLKRMKSVSQEKDAKLKQVLDSNQYNRYEQMKEELRESMRERVKDKRD